MLNYYIPTDVYKNVFEIPYEKLYAEGKKILLFDLDNTLISYNESVPSEKLICLRNKLKEIGFLIYILSNNKISRVEKFNEKFRADGFAYRLLKPFKSRMKKFIEREIINENVSLNNILFIGDQLLTDTVCCNKIGIDIYLIKTIDRESQSFFITINRSREKSVIKKIAKKNKELADKIINLYQEEGIKNE